MCCFKDVEMDVLLVLLISQIMIQRYSSQVQNESCRYVSVTTSAYVPSCPKNEEEWVKSAKNKQCQWVQKSECAEFEYHCLIERQSNRFVEFCAAAEKVLGELCVEFDRMTAIVQNDLQCTACPYSYTSTEIYRYLECYKTSNDTVDDVAVDDVANDTVDDVDNVILIDDDDVHKRSVTFLALIIVISTSFNVILIFIYIKKVSYYKNKTESKQNTGYDDYEVKALASTSHEEDDECKIHLRKRRLNDSTLKEEGNYAQCSEDLALMEKLHTKENSSEYKVQDLETTKHEEENYFEYEVQDLESTEQKVLGGEYYGHDMYRSTFRLGATECYDHDIRKMIFMQMLKEPLDTIYIYLFGQIGEGKSATANTIIGQEVFYHQLSSKQVTECFQKEYTKQGQQPICVIDSPGSDDTSVLEKIKQKLKKKLSPFQVIVCVMRLKRVTVQQTKFIRRVKNSFDEYFCRRCIVLFTRLDELDKSKLTLNEYIDSAPSIMKEFITKCGNRYIAFNNCASPTEKDAQTSQLLQLSKTIIVKELFPRIFENEAIDLLV